MHKFFYCIVCAVACLLLHCIDQNVAGGGLDTESSGGTVIGSVRLPDGSPAVGVRAYCIVSTYNAAMDIKLSDSMIRETDDSGSYRFDRLERGTYNIQVVSRDEKRSLLASGITVHLDEKVVPACTLLENSTLKVVATDIGGNDYVYLPGTICTARLQDSCATIANVPAGYIPLLCYVNTTDTIRSSIIKAGFYLSAGDVATIANTSTGEFVKKIYLNTTSSGAGVAETVYDFPVLVRLHSGNFTFSQAQADARDVRFAKTNLTPLAFEIERWDPVAGLAEVWVKADTVYGDDSTQALLMYWGAQAIDSSTSPQLSTASLSYGAGVFDTATGFQGVWHLGGAVEDLFHDATANEFHGISPDTARPQPGEGVIGNCHVFDGVDDYIIMPNTADSKLSFAEDAYYTISAWVFFDTVDNQERVIVAKGGTQYFLMVTYVPSGLPFWDFAEFGEITGWQSLTAPAVNQQWTMLTGVCRGGSQSLYCNGVLVDSVPDIYPTGSYSRSTSKDLTIGRFLELVSSTTNSAGYCFFKGAIDEVRIKNVAESSGWVRLCYMNQRADDRLVVFK